MKVLLTGSDGQLGKAIISKKPANINLLKTTRDEFDLCNKKNCKEFIKRNL